MGLRIAGVIVLTTGVVGAEPAPDGPELSGGDLPPEEIATDGSSQVIGGYASGCIDGAQRLPLDGAGFRVMKPSRRRNWGHPILITFLQELGASMMARNYLPLLVGDLSMELGGPMQYGHKSHQTGLDVDLWYWAPRAAARRLSRRERERFSARSVVLEDGSAVNPKLFGERQTDALKFAARDPRVERVFVHASVKKALCEQNADHPAWLRKIRPWWGHRDHFHARLACPLGSTDCEPQQPIPPGPGCDSGLDWWFAQIKPPEPGATPPKATPRPEPVLPERCQRLLAGTPADTAQ